MTEETKKLSDLTTEAFNVFNALSNDLNYSSKNPRSEWIRKREEAFKVYTLFRDELTKQLAKEKANGTN